MAANGLITDLYQLTMANALFKKGMHERRVVFDRFYRKNPFNLCHAGRHGRIPRRAPAPFPWHHDRGDADGDRALHDHEP